jgi:nicotinamidase-related amidase
MPQLYKSEEKIYDLPTTRHSYWAVDGNDELKLENSLPFRSEGECRFQRAIHPHKAAVIIMDPWRNMASEHLNEYFGKVVESHTLPFVKRALTLGHPVIAITNDPTKMEYNTHIDHGLQALADEGKLSVVYHQDLDDRSFASYLRSQEIETLIYTGFASNWCVLNRAMGMITMKIQGFKMLFVPAASAAVEYGDSWDDQTIHKAITMVISQSIAEIIDYDEFMEVSSDS